MDSSFLPRKRDRARENFTRATYRMMSRACKISHTYNADVYILVRKGDKHYEFNSANTAFPIPPNELVSSGSR